MGPPGRGILYIARTLAGTKDSYDIIFLTDPWTARPEVQGEAGMD
jgi:hypothetical protein